MRDTTKSMRLTKANLAHAIELLKQPHTYLNVSGCGSPAIITITPWAEDQKLGLNWKDARNDWKGGEVIGWPVTRAIMPQLEQDAGTAGYSIYKLKAGK